MENKVATGGPDTELWPNGLCVKIELKSCARPARKTSKLNFAVRDSQVTWFQRAKPKYGWFGVRVGSGDEAKCYLVPGRYAETLQSKVTEAQIARMGHELTAENLMELICSPSLIWRLLTLGWEHPDVVVIGPNYQGKSTMAVWLERMLPNARYARQGHTIIENQINALVTELKSPKELCPNASPAELMELERFRQACVADPSQATFGARRNWREAWWILNCYGPNACLTAFEQLKDIRTRIWDGTRQVNVLAEIYREHRPVVIWTHYRRIRPEDLEFNEMCPEHADLVWIPAPRGISQLKACWEIGRIFWARRGP